MGAQDDLERHGPPPPGSDMLGLVRAREQRIAALEDGDKDWETPCQNCEQVPTVHPLELCGPCCFGEADTAGGNW